MSHSIMWNISSVGRRDKAIVRISKELQSIYPIPSCAKLEPEFPSFPDQKVLHDHSF